MVCDKTRLDYDHFPHYGQLLESQLLLASTRLSTITVHDLPFADGAKINATMTEGMQGAMDRLITDCANFGRAVNANKTVVRRQLMSTTPWMTWLRS
ncbi:unnamed protein product [Dibothriocephalus latus]|uniref:Uncharacterized protein n=1 Tax=Dibothriocephalus latus TaxID=60516 RepID=A0A3P7PA37_DIBLA|nr:unnamed protein product [Dibothriocephalus latus]